MSAPKYSDYFKEPSTAGMLPSTSSHEQMARTCWFISKLCIIPFVGGPLLIATIVCGVILVAKYDDQRTALQSILTGLALFIVNIVISVILWFAFVAPLVGVFSHAVGTPGHL